MNRELGELSGLRVLIIGAAGGLGVATAKRCAELGARLMLVDHDAEALESMQSQLPTGAVAGSAVCDIRDGRLVSDLVDRANEQLGSIDVLLNIAGVIGPIEALEQYSSDAFRAVLEVNTVGTFHTMREVMPLMKAVRNGAIVNVSSVSAVRGVANEIGYGASKAAVTQMTRNAAVECGPFGVRVNAVAPGWIRTNMMTEVTNGREAIASNGANIAFGPAGRPAEPAEIADVIAFLASPRASYINGEVVIVDGGLSVR